MINEHVEQTIDILIADADFLSANAPVFSDPNIKWTADTVLGPAGKAGLFLLHIIDYLVTEPFLDMEADLLRLCITAPEKASKLKASLFDAATKTKVSYQYLLVEDSFYCDFSYFVFIYTLFLDAKIKGAVVADMGTQLFTFLYTDFEIIRLPENSKDIERKITLARDLYDKNPIDSVKDFISRCFHWAEYINNHLQWKDSNDSMLTIGDIGQKRLILIYYYCAGKAFGRITLENYIRFFQGERQPSLTVLNKEFFHTMVYAVYLSLGAMSPREEWLNRVLANAELDRANYMSTVGRIKALESNAKQVPGKLLRRFHDLRNILEG